MTRLTKRKMNEHRSKSVCVGKCPVSQHSRKKKKEEETAVLHSAVFCVTLQLHRYKLIVPVRNPVICLSRMLNCCLYFSLEACGTAQSLGTAFIGVIVDREDGAELKGTRSQKTFRG